MKTGTAVWLLTDTDPDAQPGTVSRRPPTDAEPPDQGMAFVRWPAGGRWEYVEDVTTERPSS